MRTHSFCVILLLCENCWSRQDTARTNSSTWHHTLSSPPISSLPLCWMVTWLVSQWPHPIRAALIYKIITLFVPPLPCWQNGIAHCPSPLWNEHKAFRFLIPWTSGFMDQTIVSKGTEFFGRSRESSFVGVDLTGVECARRFGQWTSGF